MHPDGTCDPGPRGVADVLAADAEAGCTGSALAVSRGDPVEDPHRTRLQLPPL